MRAVIRGVLAWVIGAAVAVGVGMLALSRIGYGFSTGSVQPLSSGPVAAPPTAPPPRGSPPPDPSTSPAPASGPPRPHRPSQQQTSRERAFSSVGGSVIVRCTRGAAYLMSWSPEQGYTADDVRRGPAPEVTVEFVGSGREVRLRVWCDDDDVPQAHAGLEHDDD